MFQTFYTPHMVQAYVYFAAAMVIPACYTYKRAGFHWTGGLMIFIPYIGFLLMLIGLALRPWPVIKTALKPKSKTKRRKDV